MQITLMMHKSVRLPHLINPSNVIYYMQATLSVFRSGKCLFSVTHIQLGTLISVLF